MKIKNSKDSINASLLQILFLVATVVGVIVRTFQRFTQIESDTGFYKEINFVNTFIMVFMILIPLVFLLLSFLSKDTKALTFEKTSSRPLFAVSFALAAAFVYDAIASLFRLATLEEVYPSAGFNEAPFLKARILLALISGVFMVFFGLNAKGSYNKLSKLFILPLAPAVWAAVRLFPLFANEISYIQVSDLFSEIFMLVFAVLFFFYLAQSVNGTGHFGCSYKVVAYGFSTAFLSAVINIPKFVATVVSADKYIASGYPLSAVDFMVFLFAATAVIAVLKSERNEDELLFENESKNK